MATPIFKDGFRREQSHEKMDDRWIINEWYIPIIIVICLNIWYNIAIISTNVSTLVRKATMPLQESGNIYIYGYFPNNWYIPII